jgi:DNA-binding PadR family transcriptional regulator
MSVRYAILGLLAQKTRHGYELRAAFEAVVGEYANWDLKAAQVYTTLERLEEAGLVERTSDLGEGDEPDRRIYAVTQSGREALKIWYASGVTPEHQRDEFFVKLMVGLASGEADPHEVIHTQQAHLNQELQRATMLRDGYDQKSALAQILLLEKTIMHLEADLRWLEMAERRLDEVKRQPLPEPELRRRGRPKKVD